MSVMPAQSTMICRLAPVLPLSVGFGPVASPPLLAGTDEASTEARNQSISPARFRRPTYDGRYCPYRLVSCQARSLRQLVIPERPTISKGSRS